MRAENTARLRETLPFLMFVFCIHVTKNDIFSQLGQCVLNPYSSHKRSSDTTTPSIHPCVCRPSRGGAQCGRQTLAERRTPKPSDHLMTSAVSRQSFTVTVFNDHSHVYQRRRKRDVSRLPRIMHHFFGAVLRYSRMRGK